MSKKNYKTIHNSICVLILYLSPTTGHKPLLKGMGVQCSYQDMVRETYKCILIIKLIFFFLFSVNESKICFIACTENLLALKLKHFQIQNVFNRFCVHLFSFVKREGFCLLKFYFFNYICHISWQRHLSSLSASFSLIHFSILVSPCPSVDKSYVVR